MCSYHNNNTVSLGWLGETLSYSTPHQSLSLADAGITPGKGCPAQELIV